MALWGSISSRIGEHRCSLSRPCECLLGTAEAIGRGDVPRMSSVDGTIHVTRGSKIAATTTTASTSTTNTATSTTAIRNWTIGKMMANVWHVGSVRTYGLTNHGSIWTIKAGHRVIGLSAHICRVWLEASVESLSGVIHGLERLRCLKIGQLCCRTRSAFKTVQSRPFGHGSRS